MLQPYYQFMANPIRNILNITQIFAFSSANNTQGLKKMSKYAEYA